MVKRKRDARGAATAAGADVALGDNSEIESEGEDDFFVHEGGESASDGENGSSEVVEETVDEKRLRLAQNFLQKLEGAEESDADDEKVHENISERLQRQYLLAKGRRKRRMAQSLENVDLSSGISFVRSHKQSVTCTCLSPQGDVAFSGGKDSRIHRWDVETQKKVGTFNIYKSKRGPRKPKKGKSAKVNAFAGGVSAMAVSDDRTYMACTSNNDKAILIWDLRTDTIVKKFNSHVGLVNGLAFRHETHELFSASSDKTVKVYSLDDMLNMETLYGHQGTVNCIDSLNFERALTCGDDRTVRLWKIVDGNQLQFGGGHTQSIDTCKMINEEHFVSGSQDGSISLWNITRKKPVAKIENAHGIDHNSISPPWISSVSACEFSDIVASGSCTGQIKLWAEKGNSLSPVNSIPISGFVNDMKFSADGRVLFAGIGQESKLGRWQKISDAQNGVAFISLPTQEMV